MMPKKLSNRNFVAWWNNSFHYDRWWREKYKTPFNSDLHGSMSILDIYLEYVEDEMFKELRTDKNKLDDNLDEFADITLDDIKFDGKKIIISK